MLSETFTGAVVLLVAPDEAAWDVLQSTVEVLERFEQTWQRWEPSEVSPIQMEGKAHPWKAVIVASSDAELPARWSGNTGLPTIRVPVTTPARDGLTPLYDESGQLPAGSAEGIFATMAIGAAGARNAALFVVAAFALKDVKLREKWVLFRQQQTAAVLAEPAPTLED